jgi:hypothetical protein
MGEGVHVGRIEPDEERLAGVFAFFMNVLAAATKSSSQVSMRFLVSGPVSSIFCFPTLPQRGSTVGSSLSVAQECITPRGPNVLRKFGKSFSLG